MTGIYESNITALFQNVLCNLVIIGSFEVSKQKLHFVSLQDKEASPFSREKRFREVSIGIGAGTMQPSSAEKLQETGVLAWKSQSKMVACNHQPFFILQLLKLEVSGLPL